MRFTEESSRATGPSRGGRSFHFGAPSLIERFGRFRRSCLPAREALFEALPRAFDELGAGLRAVPPAPGRSLRAAEEGRCLCDRARRSLSPGAFPLAQAAREVFFSIETLWRELEDFGVAPGAELATAADGLAVGARRLAEAGLSAGPAPAALEAARRAADAVRAEYESAAALSLRQATRPRAGSVDAMKAREIHRHFVRMADALRRAARALGESR